MNMRANIDTPPRRTFILAHPKILENIGGALVEVSEQDYADEMHSAEFEAGHIGIIPGKTSGKREILIKAPRITRASKHDMQAILTDVAMAAGYTADQISRTSGKRSIENRLRHIVMVKARDKGFSVREISTFFGVKHPTVRRAVKRLRANMAASK